MHRWDSQQCPRLARWYFKSNPAGTACTATRRGWRCSDTRDLVWAIEAKTGVDLGHGNGKGRRNCQVERCHQAVCSSLDGLSVQISYRKDWPDKTGTPPKPYPWSEVKRQRCAAQRRSFARTLLAMESRGRPGGRRDLTALLPWDASWRTCRSGSFGISRTSSCA